MTLETTTKTFNLVDLFEYGVKNKDVTIHGIQDSIPVKTIVETTTWYNKAVANGYESKIVGTSSPMGMYNGTAFEIKTRRAETLSEIFRIINNHLEEGETVILLSIMSKSVIDPDTFDAVNHHMVRYATVL